MNNSNYYAFLALQLANQRVAEAEAEHLGSIARGTDQRTGLIRRAIARVAFAVARAADEDVGRTALPTA